MKQYRSLFRNRNFLMLWSAGAISNIGDFFNSLALVKLLSADPARLGTYMALVMIAKVVPTLLLGPLAGVLADRLPRRTVMIASDLLRAVLVLGLVFAEHPAAIITLVFLSAAAAAFYNPASNALLPSLVPPEELVTAGSLSVMTQRLALLLGNGIGAAVLMLVGPHNVFIIDAASFVASALFLFAMAAPAAVRATAAGTEKAPAAGRGALARMTGDLQEAMAFIRRTPVMRHLIITVAIMALGDSALNVLLITFFTVDLGIAAEHLGYVWAIFGGMSIIGALIIGAVGSRVHWRYLVSFGGLYIWLAMLGALVVRSTVPSVAFMAFLGLGSGAINVGIQAAVGLLVPDQVRGRIFSGWAMVQSLIYVVGVLAAGALSDALGPTRVLLGFITFYLLGGIYAFAAFRSPPPGPRELAA